MTQALDKIIFNKNKRLIKASMPDEAVCPYCNSLMLKETKSPYSLVSIDHIKAYSKGGDDSLENLIPCCANCNTKKGNNPNAVMFRLNTPRFLQDREFILLNDFLTISTRIQYLTEIKALVLENKLKEAINLSQESELKTTSKSFFSKLTTALKTNTKPDYIIKEVIVRLKSEKDKLSELSESTSHINFSTYSLS